MTLPKTLAVVTALGVLTLVGCGSDEPETADDAGTTQTDQPSTVPSGAPDLGNVDFEAIQECLTAAGLDDVFPSDMPTDLPTDRPSDFPTDFPTDGTPPEGFPSGGPGGDGSAGLGALQDPEVQAALEACGIEMPQAPGAGQS